VRLPDQITAHARAPTSTHLQPTGARSPVPALFCSGARSHIATMGAIVRTTYRYKRPPKKRKAVALEVPAVVKAADPGRSAFPQRS
jgi:hypothetical protein